MGQLSWIFSQQGLTPDKFDAGMGIDISLFVEARIGERWFSMADLPDHPEAVSLDAPRRRELCWFSTKRRQNRLFFGEHAPFTLHFPLPDDISEALAERVRADADWAPTQHGWILVSELFLDLWETEPLLLGDRVQHRFVPAFGAGELTAAAVRRNLIHAGYELNFERGALPVGTPADWSGFRAHRLDPLPDDYPVPVTYRTTLADFAGATWTNGLAQLRHVRSPERYRILTATS